MNAYEIRLAVLNMAKDLLDQQYKETSELYWQTMRTSAEKWNTTLEELSKTNPLPTMYTPEEIIAKANELYGFVSSSATKQNRDE